MSFMEFETMAMSATEAVERYPEQQRWLTRHHLQSRFSLSLKKVKELVSSNDFPRSRTVQNVELWDKQEVEQWEREHL